MAYSTNPHSIYCRERYQAEEDDYRKKSLEAKKRFRKKHKDWDKRSKERIREYGRRSRLRLRMEILTHYGGEPPKCANCGTKDIRVLTVDHINNDGAKHREGLGIANSAGHHFYQWLKRNGFPEGFQVLCRNCNWIKRLKESDK